MSSCLICFNGPEKCKCWVKDDEVIWIPNKAAKNKVERRGKVITNYPESGQTLVGFNAPFGELSKVLKGNGLERA